jgi:hypothetical protein
MPSQRSLNPRSDALTLAQNIKSIPSYVGDGVEWIRILSKGNYELAIRFENASATVNKGLLVQYRDGNSHGYKFTKQYTEEEPS